MTALSGKTIALLGTGLMGAPMARRLIAAGARLSVWNRSRQKAEPLAADGAVVADTAAEAVVGADVVITMLSDGSAVSSVLLDDSMSGPLRAGAIVVDMSSISPTVAREIAAALSKRGIAFLDAPVSGGTKGAAEGTLAIMVGGDEQAFEAARPVFEAMGRPTRVGPTGAGQIAKLANQAIVGITIGAVAEALTMAAAGGADPAKVREALSGGFADSPIFKAHGERMLTRNFMPGGPVRMHLKDMKTVVEFAGELHLPLSRRTMEMFQAQLEAGHAEYDHSALLLEIERLNPGSRLGDRPDQAPE